MYAFIAGQSDKELAPLKLESNFKKYNLLNFNGSVVLADVETFKSIFNALKDTLNADQFEKASKIVASILKLGNMRNSIQESKPLFNEIHKILDFKSSELFTFLMMNKNGFVLKNKDFLERVEFLKEVLYCSLVNFIIVCLNDKAKNLLATSPNIQPRFALHVIDSCGFQDCNLYGNYADSKTNGFSELSANFYYESFLNFFNENRFNNQEMFKDEGIEDFFVKANYFDNKAVLENMFHIHKALIQSADYRQFSNSVSQILPTFDFDSMRKLGPDGEKPDENGDKIISFEHSFSEMFNYNLSNIFKQNSFRHFKDIKKIFLESSILTPIEAINPSFKKSRIAKQFVDQQTLFENLQNTCIWFFYCLKIPKTDTQNQRSKVVFNQVCNVDFESLILHHQKEFPYKINYRFFIEKFNIMTKIQQIKPDLNIDFKFLVSSILEHAFGENKNDLYIFGKNNLFVREKFYDEINSMLKDSGPRSRLLIFVERTLNELLKTHVDNSNVVIALAQRFLIENCAEYRFRVLLKSKEKFVKVYRKWKTKKDNLEIAQGMIDHVLNNLEYYNLKKVTKIQAIWRGRKDRKINYRLESELIAALIFKNKVAPMIKKISTTISALMENKTKVESLLATNLACATLQNISVYQLDKIRNFWAQKILSKFFRKVSICNGIRNIRIQRFTKNVSANKIIRFMRWTLAAIKTYYKKVDSDHLKLITKCTNNANQFNRTLRASFSAHNLSELPPLNLPPANDQIGKTKASYSLMFYSINALEVELKSNDNFASNICSALTTCAKDDLLKIELNKHEILFLTQKQRLIISRLSEKKQMELKLPVKVDRVSFYEDSFLYLEESGVLKSKLLSFDIPDIQVLNQNLENEEEKPESVFDFSKITTFSTTETAICGTTFCRKIFYKSSVWQREDPPKVFQMKRPVSQLALGGKFMLILDETGVVYSIGENSHGQLGIGNAKSTNRINIVQKLVDCKEIVRNISVGENHCLASTASNRVYAWGNNYFYQLSMKFKNYRLCIYKPHDITQEIKPELHTKLQVYCGQNSSYIFSSNMKLITMGRPSSTTHVSKIENKKLFANIPKGVFIIGLDVRWNNSLEIICLKVVDYRNSAFDKVNLANTNTANLFEYFWKTPDSSLIAYSEQFAKLLPLNVLSSKIVDVKNKNESQKYDKMIENLLSLK